MEPDNILLGDATGTDLPQKPVDETALNEVKTKAKYSRSKEYKELKAKADERIIFYQRFLPGNIPPEMVTDAERAKYWAIANIVIAELQQLFGEYGAAEQILKDEFGEQ